MLSLTNTVNNQKTRTVVTEQCFVQNEPAMARRASTPETIPPEWKLFPNRLNYAIEVRLQEGVSQNEIARRSGVDSGNLTKLRQGKKKDVIAPTVIRLAKALQVRPLWLLTGQEPSGIEGSEVDAQRFVGGAALAPSDDSSEPTGKPDAQRPTDVVRRTAAKRHKR